MLQIASYDSVGTISKQISKYQFWEYLKDMLFIGAKTADKIEELIMEQKIDVILVVSEFESFTDEDFIKKILSNYPYIKIVIISNIDEYTKIRHAFIKGVYDYLLYENLEIKLEHTLTRMISRQCNAYFSDTIYEKVQILAKHIFDGGNNVSEIVHNIICTIYADFPNHELTCHQVFDKVKSESYKIFVCKKPWLEKFIYRNDYIKEIGFNIKTREETEAELCRYYDEVNILFKKYNVIDANKTVYTIGKSIIKQVDRKITLESIANDVYLNKTYVSYIFKKITGISINDFILEVKTDRAKTLLHYPNMSVSEIADILYFCNGGYFTKIFKDHTNMTPTQYRDYIKNRS